MDYKAKVFALLDELNLDGKDAKDPAEEGFYEIRRHRQERQKQIYTYEYNNKLFKREGLYIVPITDVHLGNRNSNIPYFKQFVDYIQSIPNCVTILNGDLMETATKSSVGKAMFEEDKNIPEQLREVVDILKPLAKAGKILGMGPGNHEERVSQLIGVNPMEIVADRIGVPYFGYQGYFRIVVNGIPYKVVFHHGAGGGSTPGSKINASMKMNKVIGNADLYFSGHTHGKFYHEDVIYEMDEESAQLIPHKRTYVVGGSFVEYFGGYSEMKALAPSLTGLTRIELRPDHKEIRVIL